MDINQIYLGDAYELIKKLPDKSVDLIVTEAEKAMVVNAFRSGDKTVKEICDKFGIYPKDVKRIVEEAGYTY